MKKISNYRVRMGDKLYGEFVSLSRKLDNIEFAKKLGYNARKGSSAGPLIRRIIHNRTVMAPRFLLFLKIKGIHPSSLTRKDIEIYPMNPTEAVDNGVFSEVIDHLGKMYDNQS